MSLYLVCLWKSDTNMYIYIIYLCHIVLPFSTEFHNRNASDALVELQRNTFMTLLTENHYIGYMCIVDSLDSHFVYSNLIYTICIEHFDKG